MIYTEVQIATTTQNIPHHDQFQGWLEATLLDLDRNVEIVIRIVNEIESAKLNQQYRQQTYPTNVLSFPVQIPKEITLDLIGDLVICAPVVAVEALKQKKRCHDHWAHLVIHGTLHLLGYDHIEETQAQHMEAKEITVLKQLNINNPYRKIQ